MKKILTVLFIMLLFLQAKAIIYVNDITPAFPEEYREEIESRIIDGASYFLKSQSYALLFLNEYEKSAAQPFDFSAASGYLEKTISELENSKTKYLQALEIGKNAGYKEENTAKLRNFNFDRLITENKLNSSVAQQVKYYLENADITGLYQQNINNIQAILNTLYSIRTRLGENAKPGVSTAWELFQQYSQAALFGNYSTMMGTTGLAAK
ncbi:MAG: hypothetical protein KAW12_30300 [Candidatus Aminicenantes bacterium]|nr:hypothetical protein [Candidatus Aminicenantes bacterium]